MSEAVFVADTAVKNLSGGERQRLCIGLALIGQRVRPFSAGL